MTTGSPDTNGKRMGGTGVRPDYATRFRPGQVANPRGRPKGARNKLCEEFVAGLQADFMEHGPAVIAKVREDMPHQYLKIIASLVPKEIKLDDERPRDLCEYSTAELEAILRDYEEERAAAKRLGHLHPDRH